MLRKTRLNATARALNEALGRDLPARAWGRALEDVKHALEIPNDFHGTIDSVGNYIDPSTGQIIGDLEGLTIEDMNDHPDDRDDEVIATFRITGDKVVPGDVTTLVGLDPSRSWAKDDEYRLKSGQVIARYSGVWALSFSDQEVPSAVAKLLEAIEPRLDAARVAAREAEGVMSVGLWWDPGPRQGGFTMSSELFRRLAALGERIDIYFPG